MIFQIWYRTHWPRASLFALEDVGGEIKRLAAKRRKRRRKEEEEIALILRIVNEEKNR